MGTAAVAYIALLASRLPWFLGGAASAAVGAGYAHPTPISFVPVLIEDV